MISFRDQTVVVTGHTRGIGKATAELFAAAGAKVIGVSRSTHGDLSDPCTAERVAAGLESVNHLVVNHGVWPAEGVSLTGMPPTQWASTIAQNLDSCFYVIRQIAPKISRGGSIVLVSSTAGQRGEAMHADYAATKGAVIALTKSLAIEMAPDVRVNCVAPGWVDTPMTESSLAGEGRAAIAATIPLGRVPPPEDIAGPILFLCSPLARHITGEILNVNGGSVLCG